MPSLSHQGIPPCGLREAYMKFIKLESRGGNYLVVAENIAWLRTAENGQTSVGMMGGQPLLVVGSIEEVAEKILSAVQENAQPEVAEPAAPAPALPPSAQPQVPVSSNEGPSAPPENSKAEPEPEPEPQPEPAITAQVQPEPEPAPTTGPAGVAQQPDLPSPGSAPAAPKGTAPAVPPASITRIPSRNSAPLWERSAPRAAASSAGLRVKAGSQRFMGKLD